jgi:DNA-directed RNA polymerase subunit RPC12/RpoP
MATETVVYRCNECGGIFSHEWDDDDPNNDYTECPNDTCTEFDFTEIDAPATVIVAGRSEAMEMVPL